MPNFVPKGYAFGGGEEREATGGLLPAVASPTGRVDEEDRWLKKTNNTVSLPCLPRGPRPLMWQRAEGDECCNSPFGAEEDSWLKRTVGAVHKPLSLLRGKSSADLEDFPCRDTVSNSLSKGSALLDKPRRLKTIDLVARESAHMDKHRQLKTMLREQRQMEQPLSRARHLVEKQKRSKDGPKDARCRKLLDQQHTEQYVRRIAGHLQGCSQSRHELMEMQKKMGFAMVCAPPPPTTVCSDLKSAFADMLHRPHVVEAA